MIGHINLDMKQTGERNAGKLHVAFDVAGVGNGFTNELVRHSQRKRGATDRLTLRIPRQSSTLPTNYAELVSQLKAMYNQYTTMTNQYTMLKSNISHFSAKTQWKTVLNQLSHTSVKNQFGETSGMSSAMTTNSPTASSSAWTASTVSVNSTTQSYLTTQVAAGNSKQLPQLAMIETSDSISPDCLTAIGQYNAQRTSNSTANTNLQTSVLDTSSSTNSEVQQLNLINSQGSQNQAESQSQGNLQACIAAQAMLQNMQQRNAAAQDLNTWASVDAQHTSNPTSYVASSDTWTTFVP